MQEYVLGFMFDETYSKVVLIEKKRPRWQAGNLNGVGGKVEDGETPVATMRREFREETGVHHSDWRLYHVMDFNGGKIHVFSAACDHTIQTVHTATDEEVLVVELAKLPKNVINNLTWLIPMGVDPFLMGSRSTTEEGEIEWLAAALGVAPVAA